MRLVVASHVGAEEIEEAFSKGACLVHAAEEKHGLAQLGEHKRPEEHTAMCRSRRSSCPSSCMALNSQRGQKCTCCLSYGDHREMERNGGYCHVSLLNERRGSYDV
jgi:hypothetical protein